MHKKRWLYAGISVLLILSIVLGLISIAARRIPTVANQLARLDETTVFIVNPASEDRFPADAAIPITALATSGQTMTSMELWVDGSLFAAEPPEPDQDPKFFYKTWHWTPLFPGEHLITVRVNNLDGSVGMSNLLRINANEAAGYILRHTTKEGETWESLAESYETDVETIAAQNSALDPAVPLSTGAQVDILQGTLFPTPPQNVAVTPPLVEQPASYPSSPPGNVEFWLSGLLTPFTAVPTPPGLTAGMDGCTVRLLVKDNSTDEQGFEIWRSGVNGFDRLTTLGPNKSPSFEYKDTVQVSGQVQYVVSSFNTDGKTPSDIVAVDIPNGACGDPINPNISFSLGFLKVPNDLDLVYLYASLDGSPWIRMPSGDGFFTPLNGEVDMNPYLDAILAGYPAANKASLQVWGWSGGTLVNLGSLKITFDHTSLKFCNMDDPAINCTGDMGSTHWVTVGEVPSNALNSTRTFTFSANTPGVPYVLVQVSARPFTTNLLLEDPNLVDSYAVTAEQAKDSIYGKFTVNFSYYQQPTGSIQTDNFILTGTGLFPDDPSPYDESLLNVMNINGIGAYILEGLPDPTYYIRVVPWDYNKPAGRLSNPVVLTYKARQESPPYSIASGSSPAYDLEILSYSPEQKVIPSNFGCVYITAIDEAALIADMKNMYGDSLLSTNLINATLINLKSHLSSGDALCPAPLPEETTLDFVWDGLNQFWNSVVQAFNSIKNSLVNAVASGLNVLFGPDFCGSACKSGLMIALNYSITYFTGIPPTLPSFEQLVEKGVDYTVSLAISEAGISCDTDCAAKIRAGVQTVADSVTAAQSQPACSSQWAHWYGKQALCLPAGVTTQTVVGGSYIPGIVTIQATRTMKGYLMASEDNYSLQITSTSLNEAVAGQNIWFYGPQWAPSSPGCTLEELMHDECADKVHVPGGNLRLNYTIPGPMEGSMFMPVSMLLPDRLDTGSQITVPVTLNSTQTAPNGEGYIFPPLQAFVDEQAKGMGMPDNLQDALIWPLQSTSSYYLGRPGYSITFQAVLLCYDKVAQGKIPCSEPVTRTFSSDEVLALIDQLNGGQP